MGEERRELSISVDSLLEMRKWRSKFRRNRSHMAGIPDAFEQINNHHSSVTIPGHYTTQKCGHLR